MKISPWVGILWCAAALCAFLIGFTWSWFAERQLMYWLYAGRYVEAELEVTHFYELHDNDARSMVEGIVHPGGEKVEVKDSDVSFNLHDGRNDRWGHVPMPGELEGKRLPVLYWPRHAEGARWWHPPTVAARGAIPGGGAVLRDVFCGAALLWAALFCYRRGTRILKASVPPEGSGAAQESP